MLESVFEGPCLASPTLALTCTCSSLSPSYCLLDVLAPRFLSLYHESAMPVIAKHKALK